MVSLSGPFSPPSVSCVCELCVSARTSKLIFAKRWPSSFSSLERSCTMMHVPSRVVHRLRPALHRLTDDVAREGHGEPCPNSLWPLDLHLWWRVVGRRSSRLRPRCLLVLHDL